MNRQRYKWIIYLIGFTIVITLAVQVYWNIREYQINKANLVNRVQLSLDNSVESYYANLTKMGFITYETTRGDSIDGANMDTIVVSTNARRSIRRKIDSTLQQLVETSDNKPLLPKYRRGSSYPFVTSDRNFPKNLDSLISKVFVSIARDTFDLKKLNDHLNEEFERNNIDVRYAMKYSYQEWVERDSVVSKTIELQTANFPDKYLTAVSKSTFLPHRTKLELFFTNTTIAVLKESLVTILLSLLFSIGIVLSLFYLLRTIYSQKQLAEVKNDLISNITHELKTPIATIATALEALKNFNALEDKKKTENYMGIANSQVHRLHLMVDKILETASLNNKDLILRKQSVNICELSSQLIEKFKVLNPEKSFEIDCQEAEVMLELDVFHFENALGNIIDNAIKYGGPKIKLSTRTKNGQFEILIEDSGVGIPKAHREKVFEQFYRIPTGNTHDVKGFGIGLYYTRSIIERHGGSIKIINSKKKHTQFKIVMPNG